MLGSPTVPQEGQAQKQGLQCPFGQHQGKAKRVQMFLENSSPGGQSNGQMPLRTIPSRDCRGHPWHRHPLVRPLKAKLLILVPMACSLLRTHPKAPNPDTTALQWTPEVLQLDPMVSGLFHQMVWSSLQQCAMCKKRISGRAVKPARALMAGEPPRSGPSQRRKPWMQGKQRLLSAVALRGNDRYDHSELMVLLTAPK